MIPIQKKCPKCHKKYIWNPDVGNFDCPYCHGLGRVGRKAADNIKNGLKSSGSQPKK